MDSRLKSLQNLLEDSPNDGFVLFAIAKEYEGREDFETALGHYEKLRSIDPDYVGLYFHLGGLYAELDESEKAMDIYEKGIAVATKINDHHALSELKGVKMNLELGL